MSISGKKVGCKIGAAVVAGIYKADADMESDDLDATVGTGGGFTDTDAGCDGCTVQIAGWFDVATGVATDVKNGTVITNFKMFRDITDVNPAILMPTAIVTKFHLGAAVRDRVEFTATIKNKGTYTYNDP